MNDYEKIQKSIMETTTYKGIPTYKNPMDAWTYQEIIWETRPDIIVEIGNKYGGSLLMLSDLLWSINENGFVIGIDLDHSQANRNIAQLCLHNNIQLFTGDACSSKIFETVWSIIPNFKRVMVIEDSAHTYVTTAMLLEMYSPLVTVDCYYIVEDTVINHGLSRTGYGDKSAYEAVEEFAEEHPEFLVDGNRERPFTWNPSGFLRRIAQ